MPTQSILVTGATGFIGRHLVPELQHGDRPLILALPHCPPPNPYSHCCVIPIGNIHTATGQKIPLNTYTIHRLISSLAVDISKLKNVLHWHPPHTTEMGIKTLFHHFY